MKRNIIAVAAILLSSCAHVDTGQIDYRVADEPSTLTTRDLSVFDGGRCDGDAASACDPILPARVVRRYMPGPDSSWKNFKAPDVYSIEIEQGMIGSNILEGKLLGRQFGKTAEVAILANVFEFAGQDTDAASRRFLETGEYPGKSDDPSDVELKLVHFSDDIKRGQAFNFSNIPLRARTEYGGGSIGIQIVVMEVDAQAGPVASLLKTLARFGQQVLPGPGEVKDMLFDLGESLLSGSQDDKLFDYRFVLSAAGDNPREVQATFAPGRYVLMRKQLRNEDMDWASLRLDHNTSRLFRPADTALNGKYQEVRDDLYLVINMRRYPAGTRAEFYSQRDWSSFRDALQLAADTTAAPLGEVTKGIEGMLGKERSANWRSGLSRQWSIAADRLDLFSARYINADTEVDISGCGVDRAELDRRRDAAERGAEDALRSFVADYRAAANAPVPDSNDNVAEKEFAVPDRERLVSTVAAWFMPWGTSGAIQAKFKDAATFEASYMAEGAPDDLITTALTAAMTRSATEKTCAALLTR